MNRFIKSHGLGNSYLVFDQEQIDFEMTPENIIRLCSVNMGVGSDGILLKVPSQNADFGMRILNPDGSEAEKSGNGLRIFGKFLFDYGYTAKEKFSVETPGGIVQIDVLKKRQGKAHLLKAAMGKAIFDPRFIPVVLKKPSVLGHKLTVSGEEFRIHCVSIGNPHCVILEEKLQEKKVRKFGPLIENLPIFPSKINVQFARILNPGEAEILIWERGAGYTTASGSSSCAVAAIGKKLGLLGNDVNIHMPGGQLKVQLNDDWEVYLTGPVEQVFEGHLT